MSSEAAHARIDRGQKRALGFAIVGIALFLVWGWHDASTTGAAMSIG